MHTSAVPFDGVGIDNFIFSPVEYFSLSIAKQDDCHQYVQFKKSLGSGIYFLKDLSSNGIFLSKKMVVR